VAEQADAPDSKSGDGDIMWVRPPPSAPFILSSQWSKVRLFMTLSHCYLKFAHHTIFQDFNFNLALGQCTCLLGPSGIGKSSLLKILAGLIKPDSIKHYKQLDISYLPQQDCLLPWLSVWDNISIGSTLRRDKSFSKNQALALLDRVGLTHAIHLKPNQLSGGMKQRVALVRTLMENKPVILMDEPFSSLDMATRLELHALTLQLLQGKTVLLVTHDPLDAVRLADRVHLITNTPAELSEPILIDFSKPRDLQALPIIKLYMQLLAKLCGQSLNEHEKSK
jgi:putative hydroxymethylpyrimidine transport system ATP-binding protein